MPAPRSGNPLLTADLDKVSCAEARSIIVLASPGLPQQSDARVLRITLSLLGLHDRLRKDEGLPGLQAIDRALVRRGVSRHAEKVGIDDSVPHRGTSSWRCATWRTSHWCGWLGGAPWRLWCRTTSSAAS